MGFGLLMLLMAFASPVPWLLLAGLVSICRRGTAKHAGARRRGMLRGAALDVGAAFLFLSVAYRPNHAFLVKAQIRQVEDGNEDGQGGPDSPLRNLHRQLRRIRRGEPVEQLVWRLE
ncbi:MAG TPA: hypothetical protein VMU71_05255 [Terracidiphilus sp.]|nr:hypothetical protein [Terracidiphilus sp.]